MAKRRLALAMALLVAMAGGASACTLPANAAGMEAELARLMNAERKRGGLAELEFSADLRRAAERQVCDMADSGVRSHTGTDGSRFATRLRAAGGCPPGGENLAWGQRSAAATFAGWMASRGHRANLLHRGATSYGIAVALPGPRRGGGPLWVLVVGRDC